MDKKAPRVGILKRIFTWWDGATIGTQVYTKRAGRRVGEDAEGNIYYAAKKGGRRWVIYNGPAEASRVPAEWHGWLHHTTDLLPDDAPVPARSWEKPHLPNLTGTASAYAPKGAISSSGPRARATGDYEAWKPN